MTTDQIIIAILCLLILFLNLSHEIYRHKTLRSLNAIINAHEELDKLRIEELKKLRHQLNDIRTNAETIQSISNEMILDEKDRIAIEIPKPRLQSLRFTIKDLRNEANNDDK